MESSMKNLYTDHANYVRSFQVFLDRSTEHKCMLDFINKQLPDIFSSIGNGRPTIEVLGIGSGAGEIDLHMLSKLQAKHAGVHINNEVVDSSEYQIKSYEALVAKAANIENITFSWNKMTSSEYEAQRKEKNECKKFDFIHMIQMLYYVKDAAATVKFFHSCLEKNGKLLIILVSAESGWHKLWKTFGMQFSMKDLCLYISAKDIEDILDTMGAKYKHYDLPSDLDITECFTEGNENGELLLDFLTEIYHFSKTAPSDLKAGVMELLRHPECSRNKNGKIMFNNNLTAIVVES
ncbi:histamine N-methyltransferase [Latimeria chalumnae]|uniref:Histamine N-methyltransferase n=1 Tax=Latimeria chalumnae TaxID=7897 RepID=H3APF2_LATCH|nr:PREDICTED: histamine N-methyltransferase [Latimeria chalumnae]|eukprot:XP_006004140.1 PREDICTED: histamine N-methyltransferase [Latimeria chalumnae]